MADAPKPERAATAFSVAPLHGMAMFAAGTSVALEVRRAAEAQALNIGAGDIVVVAQKIVSKSEGRRVRLRDVEAGDEARALAAQTGRPAALMQLMLNESAEIMRVTPGVVIARHRSGHVAANAGIDASNVEGGKDDEVLLWPLDPDASAARIRAELAAHLKAAPAVLIADSLGRAWRLGTVGAAIGCAGLVALEDRRGEVDLFGRTLMATLVAVADSIAAAAVLAMGEGAEGAPAAVVRGLERYVGSDQNAARLIRPLREDLFR